MKKYNLIVFFLFVCLGFSMSQTNPNSSNVGSGVIKGAIVDSLTQEKIEYATISLINTATGKAVNGAMADEKGKFTLDKINEGTYKLVVAFIGYKSKVINNINITSENNILTYKNISLAPMVQITNEVVVKGERAMIEEKVDRTVYNAEADPTNKGADASEVLRKAPMLSVDLDGNVSMRGSQNVKVLINNKPSTITAGSVADALKQIPGDQIKSVEVITSPSSKYDAEGSAGIINIILKKNNLEGQSMNIDASAGYRMSSLGLNGAYRRGKMGFSLGGHGRAVYNVPGSFENIQITPNSDGTQRLNKQTANTENQRVFGAYTLGWDYDINKKNFINSSIKYSFKNIDLAQNDLKTTTYKHSSTLDSLLSSSLRNTTIADLSKTIDANLNYTRYFDTPQREFNFMTLYSTNDRTNDFINTTLAPVTNRLKNLNSSRNQEFTLQADFQTPLDSNQQIELGVKNITRKVSSDYQYLFASGLNGEFVPSTNTQLSNSFNYNQNVTAGYLSYTLNFFKTYSLKAGARYEYTTINAAFGSDTSVVIPAYGILVPSINLSKRLANGNTLKASYTRRIQRPSLQFLNPNFQTTNPLNITIGNPNLGPEYTNNYELAYSTMIKSTNLSIAAFARNTNNSIQSVRDIIGDTIRTTYKNIGQEDAYGVNIFANTRMFSNKLTLNGSVDIYYAYLSNNVSNYLYNATNQGWVVGYRATGAYKLPKEWSVQLFGFYRGQQVQLQGFQGGFGIYSLVLKKDFNNKKASLGFGFDNFFTPSFYMRNQLNSPVISQKSTVVFHNSSFKITFSLNLGGMTSPEKQRRKKSVSNDDMKKENDANTMEGGGGAPQGGGNQPKGKPGK
jgi:outer membrane receptor protein involved in Fe transport